MQEKFLISFGAGNRTVHQLCRVPKRLAPHLRTLSQAARCSSGSRTIPPLPTSARPTSNCGFIRITISPCGCSKPGSTGTIRVTDMKLTSHTAMSQSSGISVGGQMARVRLILHDDARIGPDAPIELCGADIHRVHARGSALQQTVGEAAPVDAPISIHTLPVTSISKCVSAASSFKPPRLTKGRLPRISTDASAGTECPGFSCLLIVYQNAARQNQRLRLLSRLDETAIDQQLIEP